MTMIKKNRRKIMANFLICLIISIMLSFGMAILLVEKGGDWPVRPLRIRLQLLLSKIHWKLPQALFCAPCTSVWAALISDIILCIISGGSYFFWPCSGIIVAGMTWSIIEFLNGIDKEQNINVFMDKED